MNLDIDLDQDELADRLGGALPQGSLILVEGPSGAGKSVLSQRLTYGLLANGADCTYISSEFTTPAFLHQMDQLGYGVMEEFMEQELLFASTHPLLGHPVDEKALLPRLWEATDLMTRPAVVVDTFSRLAAPHFHEGSDVVEHTVRMVKRINSAGTTLILTVNPDDVDGVDTTMLASAADVRLQCTTERRGGKVNRFVEVKKFTRAPDTTGDLIPFRVEPGAGFIVEIKSVA